jgi:hypothetical protein
MKACSGMYTDGTQCYMGQQNCGQKRLSIWEGLRDNGSYPIIYVSKHVYKV